MKDNKLFQNKYITEIIRAPNSFQRQNYSKNHNHSDTLSIILLAKLNTWIKVLKYSWLYLAKMIIVEMGEFLRIFCCADQ